MRHRLVEHKCCPIYFQTSLILRLTIVLSIGAPACSTKSKPILLGLKLMSVKLSCQSPNRIVSIHVCVCVSVGNQLGKEGSGGTPSVSYLWINSSPVVFCHWSIVPAPTCLLRTVPLTFTIVILGKGFSSIFGPLFLGNQNFYFIKVILVSNRTNKTKTKVIRRGRKDESQFFCVSIPNYNLFKEIIWSLFLKVEPVRKL